MSAIKMKYSEYQCGNQTFIINKLPMQFKLCYSDIKSPYTNGKLFKWNESNSKRVMFN